MPITDISHRKKFLNQDNVYLPHIAVIDKIIEETPTVRTYHFNFKDEKLREDFTFESGQFAECSVFGIGEATFCISSSPTRRDHLEFAYILSLHVQPSCQAQKVQIPKFL